MVRHYIWEWPRRGSIQLACVLVLNFYVYHLKKAYHTIKLTRHRETGLLGGDIIAGVR